MSAAMNFRSAFNGFNREDVVKYIEYLNTKHSNELAQLTSENEELRAKLSTAEEHVEDRILLFAAQEARNQLEQQVAALTEHAQEMERMLQEQKAQNEELTLKLQSAEEKSVQQVKAPSPAEDLEKAQLRTRCDSLEDQLLMAQNRCTSLEQQLQDANSARLRVEREREFNRMNYHAEQELEAYRRAERTERVARERSELVYRQANTALTGATEKVDNAFAMISELSDQVANQLAQLQSAITGSKQALADAATTLYTIRPGSENH